MNSRYFSIVRRFLGVFLPLCVLLLVFSACLGSNTDVYGGLGAPGDPVPFMEKARTGTLPSGLRYFILENSKPEKRAFLTLAVKAGSVLETDDEQGLAHFVEHVAFNGTERFPHLEVVNYLRSLGMRFGPEVNAYTSFDQTVYEIEVPTEIDADGKLRIPDKALAIIDDWSRAVTFNTEEVDNERPIILEEYRGRLGASERIRRKMLPILFEESMYADRWPIGKPEIIENVPASKLKDFYHKWYQADNMAIIFSGDFDGEALETSLEKNFTIPKPSVPMDRPQHDLPDPKRGKTNVLITTDPELTTTRVSMYYKRDRQLPRSDLSYFREEIIDILIDRMLEMRLDEGALNPDSPYVSAGAGNAAYGASSRFFVMLATAKTASCEQSLAELLKEKEKMLRYGFTDTELSLAAASLISDTQQMVSEKDKQESDYYSRYLVNYFLDGGNLADIEWELDAIQKLLPHITAKDINATIKDYFKWGDVFVFISAPEAEMENLPTDAKVRQLLRESRRMKIAKPKSAKVGEGFLSETPGPGTIVSEVIDADTGAHIWKLSNGAQVILKETNNRNNEIIFQAMARGGTTSASMEDRVSAALSAEMISASGLGPYSLTDLMKKLADKQVAFSFWNTQYYRGFQGSASTEDLKNLFEMIYIGFTDPRIDSDAVKVMLDKRRTALAQRNESPDNVFSDEVTRTIYSGHPFFKPLELADLDEVNIEYALNFIINGLNPADYTFVFVGNIDLETLRVYIETYLASIPQRFINWNKWNRIPYDRPGKIEKSVYKGKEEQSRTYLVWYNKYPYTEQASITAQVLSEYLDIVMTEEIREKLGGVYSISVGASVSPVPDGELSMSVYFACDPARATELANAVIALLQKTATPGNIDGDTFVKSVAALKKQWEVSMQSNSYIAQSYVNSSVLLRQPLSRLNKRPQYFDAVTQADIQRLCAQALANGPARIVLYPESEK